MKSVFSLFCLSTCIVVKYEIQDVINHWPPVSYKMHEETSPAFTGSDESPQVLNISPPLLKKIFFYFELGASPVAQWQRICLQCRSRRWRGFDPWVRKIPWRRAWQPNPVFLPAESHGQRSLAGYSPWGQEESDMTEAAELARVHKQNIPQRWFATNETVKIVWQDWKSALKE